MSDEDIINEVRDKIREKQEIIKQFHDIWKRYLEFEKEPFRKDVDKTFVSISRAINNLYMYIEGLTIMSFGLKNQIDLLRDILVQIPIVRDNPEIQKDIEKVFGGYEETMEKQMKSFKQSYGIKGTFE